VNAVAGSALPVDRAGQAAKARELLARADSLSKSYQPLKVHTVTYLAESYLGLGDTKQALRLLTEYRPRADLHFQLHLRCDPLLDPVATNPAFQSLLLEGMPRPPQGC
jgi:hypothetical protein